MCDLLSASIELSLVVAHAGTRPTPVPHWIVLIIGVIGLWVIIGGGLVVLEWLLARRSGR
ncbi:hypothetical protein [Halococcus sp. AFM35]|uniref:hypothetical protein n=1 Tax=Halococcus sp. AFM35 TaxID=3421653 RepID=UPI003EBF3EBC